LHGYARNGIIGNAGEPTSKAADLDWQDQKGAVYTVKIGDVVYALHAFQKKSARGIATPKAEIALIKQRLKEASIHYEQEIGDSNE
jgi:phage-related protein